MGNESKNVKICEPVDEKNFSESIKLIDENICRDKNFGVDYLKSLSSGEMLVAKNNDRVIGVLAQRRPGKIFNEIADKFFVLDKIAAKKKDIGYIVLVAVDPKNQGMGIGKKLLVSALDLQKKWKAKCVGVHCWQGSPGNSSRKLFENFGFSAIKLHKAPWAEFSQKAGPKDYWCVVCGNPCTCDELEMVISLK